MVVCIWYATFRDDSWISDDESVDIRGGSTVRVRIEGLDIDAGVIVSLMVTRDIEILFFIYRSYLVLFFSPQTAIGSIKDSYLGQIM